MTDAKVERARLILTSELGLLTDAFDRMDAEDQQEVAERLAAVLEQSDAVLGEAGRCNQCGKLGGGHHPRCILLENTQ